MTNREFFNAVINGNVTDEVIAHAQACVANLDKRNTSRATKASEVNEPIKARIIEYLTDKDYVLGIEVAKSFNGEFTSQKILGLLNKMVENGICEKQERKIEKVGKRMAYRLC